MSLLSSARTKEPAILVLSQRLDQPSFGAQGENDMNWVALIIQLISGGVGGNIAGALLKKFDLGPVGNSIAGLIGGGLGGQLLGMLTSGGAASSAMSAASAAAGSSLDLNAILSSIGGGGVGGAVLMAIVGLIKGQMSRA
jgi:uncharacterized membrane protein YeaQ/YmgE (transglycosylase-associated protein family)